MTRLLAYGITGRARHGKDSVANILVGDYGAKKYSFAAKLKALALRVDPWIDTAPMARLSTVLRERGEEGAKDVPEVRRFYQELGTRAREVLGSDVWVRAVLEDARRDIMAGHPVVFSDVRFPNEAAAIRDLGGVLIRVLRPGFDNGVDPSHPSESQVDDLGHDFTILNSGAIEDLNANLYDHLHNYMVGRMFRG